jgi:hypothetical protein
MVLGGLEEEEKKEGKKRRDKKNTIRWRMRHPGRRVHRSTNAVPEFRLFKVHILVLAEIARENRAKLALKCSGRR